MFPNTQLKWTLLLFGLFLLSSESLRCNIGFTPRNNSCVDTDECVMDPGVCGDHAQCFNTPGSYYCNCNKGFQSTPPNFTQTTGQCLDIDECSNPDICGTNAQCRNKVGSYSCKCHQGYSNYGKDQSKCTGLFLLSSESLRCNIGFTPRNNSCVDTDECVMDPGVCGNHAQCFNTPGSYYCNCDEGFQATSPNFTQTTGQCLDINECLMGTYECPGDMVCVNTIGSFNCTCPNGYKPSRIGCLDIDECKDNPDICGTNAQCRNHQGSYSCKCHQGYSNYGKDQSKCTEIVHFCVDN